MRHLPMPLLSLLLLGLVALPAPGARGQETRASSVRTPRAGLTADEWRQDLREMRARLEAAHIDLFHAVTRVDLDAAFAALEGRVDELGTPEVLTEISRLAAMVHEGHTSARILDAQIAGTPLQAYPLLPYVYADGVRLRAVPEEHADLLGARIVSADGTPLVEARRRLEAIISADNDMGRTAWLPYYLVTREVLEGLGIADGADGLTLELERLDGSRTAITLDSRPIPEIEALVLDPSREEVARTEEGHDFLRARSDDSYWLMRVPGQAMLYVRINRLISRPERPWTGFVEELEAELGRGGVERLVLDLRGLSGGNHISLPLIHALVRHPQIDRRGRLFALIGRNTFSAGQNLATLLEQQTNALFVGEPTGGRPNSYGSLGRFTLANSGLEVRHSRYYIQDADPADYRPWIEPDVWAPPSVQAELEGRDPALEAVLAYRNAPPPHAAVLAEMETTFAAEGLEAALALGRRRAEALLAGGTDAEREINNVGYSLLRESPEAALAVFRFNVELFPDSYNTHDSLGEALRATGELDAAAEAYRRSVEINAYNDNARRMLRVIVLDLER